MSDSRSPTPVTIPPFVRDDDLRQSIELLFFAYRDFTGEADQMLVAVGFGRAHPRAIYFIGRNPGITVGGLLRILKIT
ncbi:MAG: MarR family transcriptional regulator, partial [Reyranellaceae bacterium]